MLVYAHLKYLLKSLSVLSLGISLTSRHVVSVSVPLYHVTAVVGDAVYLPCNISTGADDDVLLVLWYREDRGTPIYRSVTESICGKRVVCLLPINVPGVKGNFYHSVIRIYHCLKRPGNLN
jgi:hypothetical protein